MHPIKHDKNECVLVLRNHRIQSLLPQMAAEETAIATNGRFANSLAKISKDFARIIISIPMGCFDFYANYATCVTVTVDGVCAFDDSIHGIW